MIFIVKLIYSFEKYFIIYKPNIKAQIIDKLPIKTENIAIANFKLLDFLKKKFYFFKKEFY